MWCMNIDTAAVVAEYARIVRANDSADIVLNCLADDSPEGDRYDIALEVVDTACDLFELDYVALSDAEKDDLADKMFDALPQVEAALRSA